MLDAIMKSVEFEHELASFLPPDLPYRAALIQKAAHHLRLIAEANEYMNLTRITTPREAAIKHVYDAVAPWQCFAGVTRILDAGSGAGYPGVPLAVIMPEVQFTLSESIQKKARFLETVVENLELTNVRVTHERAEDVALNQQIDLIMARAVAPVSRILELFRKPLKRGARLLLYKGSDVEAELMEAQRHRVAARLLCTYELPEDLGSRSLLELKTKAAARAGLHKQAPASQ
jgi:16S rRNA (guanine527-N7)-methyltransferase